MASPHRRTGLFPLAAASRARASARRRRGGSRRTGVIALAAALILASTGWAWAADPLWKDSAGGTPPPEIARLNNFMNELAERLKPALVQIRVKRAVEVRTEGQDPFGGPEDRTSSGSGFIIRQDGYLVTNAHVVSDAERIQVKLSDNRRFEGRLIGQDDRVDLALIKIEATGLPVAELGDSNRLRVGEFVLALGHPFGLEQTVSFGIVSRKGAPLLVAPRPASTSSRRMPRSIPATPAGRSSTWRARWSASTAWPRATAPSASPSR